MAIGTEEIAFLYFCQYPLESVVVKGFRNVERFRFPRSVIPVHYIVREPESAVRTRVFFELSDNWSVNLLSSFLVFFYVCAVNRLVPFIPAVLHILFTESTVTLLGTEFFTPEREICF